MTAFTFTAYFRYFSNIFKYLGTTRSYIKFLQTCLPQIDIRDAGVRGTLKFSGNILLVTQTPTVVEEKREDKQMKGVNKPKAEREISRNKVNII